MAIAATLVAPGTALAARWCGTEVVATNRLPESFTGKQIHVTYAFPADGQDRFADAAHTITSDIEAIDNWWRGQDSTRALRFDLFPFPGCGAAIGRLDLTRAQLPRPASEYMDASATLGRLSQDLAADPFALGQPYVKYLVYYDGPPPPGVCGQGFQSGEQGGRFGYAVVYMRACWQDVGSGGAAAWTAAHELGHSLGAVTTPAPNRCPDGSHACDFYLDLMRSVNYGHALAGAILDYGNDDYYNHSGGWTDIRDSAWLFRLDQPRHRLQVAVTGSTGGSTILSAVDDPGIACPPTCANDWDAGATVALEYELGGNDRFVGWRGGCTGADTACTVLMDAPKTITAVFGPSVYRLSLSVVGRGTVRTSEGQRCALRRCAFALEPGSAVRLTAKPARGFRFVRWGGSCRGKRGCVVRGSAHRSVTAVFRRR